MYIEVDDGCMTVCHVTQSKIKVKVMELLKFQKFHFLNSYLLCHLQRELANYSAISIFDRAGFLIFVLLFVSRDLELGRGPCS